MDKIFPLQVNSWTILSDIRFVKKMDKSTFVHHGTGIPMKISKFWNIDKLEKQNKKYINIFYKGVSYKMNISRDIHGRFRLFWNSDFSKIIKEKFEELYASYKNDEKADKNPEMIFTYLDENRYEVEFIEEVFLENEKEIFKEGSIKYYYGKRFERDKDARAKAISLHGIDCKACGFNFERKYGELGKDFIEIHHSKPLYINQKEMNVDPNTDLVPVCPNCHRMIHRKQHEVLTVEQIQSLIEENKGNFKY